MTGKHVSADEEALAKLLDQRYGNGAIFLQDDDDRLLLDEAVRRGLVTEEGYLTPAGYKRWANWQDRPRHRPVAKPASPVAPHAPEEHENKSSRLHGGASGGSR